MRPIPNKRLTVGSVVVVVALAAGGCSDDSGPDKADQGTGVDLSVTDLGLDQTADQALDGDASIDLGPDTGHTSADAALAGTVKGTITVNAAKVTCGTSAADDCKGMLIFAIIDQKAPPPTSTMLAQGFRQTVDLSGGKSITYQLDDVPTSAPHLYIGVALLETATQLPNPPLPVTGDIVTDPPPVVGLTAGKTVAVDVALDARF